MAAEGHKDAILDCAYNFYGNRLATCSVDHTVIVWDQDEAGNWEQQHKLEKHCSIIQKIDWAHPEFGQALASCSNDRTVVIWEETQDRNRKFKWAVRAQLVDSRSAVVDVKFAPHHLGLKLATASEDGCVRLYEAVDVMNLAYWPLSEEFLVDKSGVSCIAWNQSGGRTADEPPSLVVASGETSSPVVKIWEYSEDARSWRAKIELKHSDGAGSPVRCLDWAPKMGRSFHCIASGCHEKIRIWKLKDEDSGSKNPPTCQELATGETVWRAKWNITGTVLASSGEKHVRLWKCNEVNGEWQLHSEKSVAD